MRFPNYGCLEGRLKAVPLDASLLSKAAFQ